MSESTQGKKKSASKSGSSGKKKNPGSAGAPKKKRKKPAGRTVEMSGNQMTVDEVIADNTSDAPRPKRPRTAPEDPEPEIVIELNEENNSVAEDTINEQVSWNQQISSIVFWLLSLILLALTFFPGESIWTVIHNFILGVLGFKAFLWAALLVYSGYLYARQTDRGRINEIIRSIAGLIVLSDVIGYILIQSNGYRDVYNELSFSVLPLFAQIYHDGSKVGGTGLLGGFVGEALLLLAGKFGAFLIASLLLIAVAMILSHTGPVALFDDTVRKFKRLFSKETYRFLFEHRYDYERDVDTDILPDDDEIPIFDPDAPEEALEPMEPSGRAEELDPAPLLSALPAPEEEGEAASTENDPDSGIIAPAGKKHRMSKAEEVRAESEEFGKQVDSASTESEREYVFPPLRLLIPPEKSVNLEEEERARNETSEILLAALEEHKIRAKITNISSGPTVTRFEITPAQGVRINQITSRSKDIALRLAAKSIRIEAPIPGKAAVGIEIPNKVKQMVRIREIVGSREFMEAGGPLVSALGRDIEGNSILCDLSKMPHLLIAGSTGSGKSVCINSILISLIYKYSPEDVKMILIDPKSVEFDMYNGIPHLLVPVVCDPKKAAGALQWAVSEMEKRYEMLKERGVRSIDNYNRMAVKTGEFPKLSRIIIVIDEMADLMLTTPKEVEDSISRLAAKARAAGMHMVFATQRPSVEVITGTIKNNIPSRIALAVTSNVDSRTILDEGGAENLIGNGDMIYHPMGTSKHTRVQGCFVDDMEVERVIGFVKHNCPAEYDDSIAEEIERNSRDGSDEKNADFDDRDVFFDRAVEIILELGQASASMLQRRLQVGYARAGRIIDQLEMYGFVGPSEGSKPRAVLITKAQWLEMTMARDQAGKENPPSSQENPSTRKAYDSGENARQRPEFFDSGSEQADDYPDEENDDLFSEDEPESDTLPAGTDDPEDAGEIPVVPSANEEEPESQPYVGPRDFSSFFDDNEVQAAPAEGADNTHGDSPRVAESAVVEMRNDSGEETDATGDSPAEEEFLPTETPDQEDSEDIPPWEELFPESPAVKSAREEPLEVSDEEDDFFTVLKSDTAPERVPRSGHSTAPTNGLAGSDADDDDDILLSPWIKRL